MDKISGLPNEVICHIVSFLSAKDAAFTSVLSKRFQNLFTVLPNLQFSDLARNHASVMGFLDGLLALPASSRIRKFSLECRYSDTINPIHYAHINCCLCDVLKRGVLNLELSLHVQEGYSLPFEVFTSKTFVLKLGTGFVIDFLPGNAFLPTLETLFLSSVQFCDLRGCAFQMLFSACPVLKELNIDFVDWECWKWSRTISIPTLQRLTVKRSEYADFDGTDLGSIAFNTPSLVFLEYCDYVPDEYPIVNLDSLVEAKLDLIVTINHGWLAGDVDAEDNITSDLTNLIRRCRCRG